jgi:beta-glucuronidase
LALERLQLDKRGTPPEMWMEEYQVEFLRHYLDAMANRPFVAGMHVWAFADFKTGQNVIRGRRPKTAAHFLRSRRMKNDGKAMD